MYVTQHNAKDFRNLENAVILPDRFINIIFGENGQGKTNLIESIWLFTGCHSFRTRKNSQLIRENCERSMLDISFFAFDRDQTARLEPTAISISIPRATPARSPSASWPSRRPMCSTGTETQSVSRCSAASTTPIIWRSFRKTSTPPSPPIKNKTEHS